MLKQDVTITRTGKPVAMIVSKNEYEGCHETSEICGVRNQETLYVYELLGK